MVNYVSLRFVLKANVLLWDLAHGQSINPARLFSPQAAWEACLSFDVDCLPNPVPILRSHILALAFSLQGPHGRITPTR